MKRRTRIWLVCIVLGAAAATAGFFLLKRQGETPQEGDPVRIAAILMSAEVPFWDGVWEGARQAAQEAGAALSEYPYEQRSETITDLVETAILAEVDGILLRAPDTPEETLLKMLECAAEKGIHVVTVDVDAGARHRDAFIGIDNEQAAGALAEDAARRIDGDEKAVIVKTPDAYMSYAASLRVEAFEKRFEELGKADSLRTLELPGEDELRLETLMDFLETEKNVRLLFGCAPKVTAASVNAVKRLNLEDSVCVVGFGESEEILDGVRQGIVACLVMQESYEMGWMGIEYLTRMCGPAQEEEDDTDMEIIVPFRLMTPDMFLEE